ncbi:LysM domain-containing protein [Sporolactobacillus sp. CQH2019]|uniref:LysM peptidoglycan-binding domain-containing protein n=1 Tax=Sporolactobacillus sp. CQH2019 TaxID=3023512 RepID=UPI002367F7FE|nr:LysM domain-containing protein [Sporolactobacillus sp. CQH2019]MDD9147563.1 LysM domain-containing protein [Sporolactobacillus sp. CQH2019]
MKRRIFTLLFLIACWTSYTDLTSGSLPAGTAAHASAASAQSVKVQIPSQRITVAPGDTLLSVAERINKTSPSIDQVIKDFAILNPSVDPNHLQIGRTYAFPYYDRQP